MNVYTRCFAVTLLRNVAEYIRLITHRRDAWRGNPISTALRVAITRTGLNSAMQD